MIQQLTEKQKKRIEKYIHYWKERGEKQIGENEMVKRLTTILNNGFYTDDVIPLNEQILLNNCEQLYQEYISQGGKLYNLTSTQINPEEDQSILNF